MDFSEYLKPSTEAKRQVQDEMLEDEFTNQRTKHKKEWDELASHRHDPFCKCGTCQQIFEDALKLVGEIQDKGYCFKYLIGFTSALTMIAKISTQLQVGAGPFPTPVGELTAALHYDEDFNAMVSSTFHLDNLRKICDQHIEKARAVADGKVPPPPKRT